MQGYMHSKNRIIKITNVLVSTVARIQNYNLIGHTGCCYDCMVKDTIINYHVQYLIIRYTKKVWKPKMI